MTPSRSAVRHLLLAAACLAAGPALGDSEAGLPLKAEREARFTVDKATWLSLDVAPSGDQLALEILGDLYLLPIEGGTAKAISQGMGYDVQPRFSPDGKRIAFVSDRDGAIGLWTLPLDGGEPEKLASPGQRGDFASPEWSPDGQHVIVAKTSFGLRGYELWAYHIDGGKGVQITQSAPEGKKTPRNLRHNALGAVYSPDGRYLYYATKPGGFSYNQMFPQWWIVRRDLREGTEDAIIEAQGSAMRPRLSPDGSLLAYATRYEQQTGLRLRNLETGEDRWLAYPVQRDDQESRYTRDLLPGYAFAPDGQSLFFTADGGIRRVSIETGEVADIPFSADLALGLGPSLQFPWRLGLGPVKARLIRAPALSPDGGQAAFSAFNRIHRHDLASGTSTALSPEGLEAFHPTFSPDGRQVAFVSWGDEGGHIWRMRANGRGQPKRLTERPGFYSDPAFSPDGERIVALRATSHERLQREFDFGTPTGADLIWLPANGGPADTIMPARGYGPPHFGPEDDRIYLYAAANPFGAAEGSGLMSVRYDGTDRRLLLSATGPGIYSAEGEVGAADIRLAPDGRHALIHHANQLYLARLLNRNLGNLTLSLTDPSLPVARLTDVGADFFGWSAAGDELHWSAGNRLYQRRVADVEFDVNEEEAEGKEQGEPGETETADDGDDGPADSGDGAGKDDRPLLEADPSVRSVAIEIYRPRHRPEGRVALVGARIHSMAADQPPIEDGVVLIEADRILAVGERDAVDIPANAQRIDLGGKTILPGYVDTHAHFRVLRRVHGGSNPSFLANLAYGVTTGLDVQPSTTDILAYEDLIDAGLLIGPRALSTGPGIFNNNEFRSRPPRRGGADPLPGPLPGPQPEGLHLRQPPPAPMAGPGRPQAEADAHHRGRPGHEAQHDPRHRRLQWQRAQLSHRGSARRHRGAGHPLPHELHADAAGHLRRPVGGELLLRHRIAPRRPQAATLHAAAVSGRPHPAPLLVPRARIQLPPGGSERRQDHPRRRPGGRRRPRPTAGPRLPLGTLGAGQRRPDRNRSTDRRHPPRRGDHRRGPRHRHRRDRQAGGPGGAEQRPDGQHPQHRRPSLGGQGRRGV